MIERKPFILLIGTHLPQDAGSRSVGEELAERLRRRGFHLKLTSRSRSRLYRVADILVTTWLSRHSYDVAQIDVYSGSAFRWAEWATGLVRRIGKPFVLTLRGGNLPAFARKHPARIARLLSSATAVTAPSDYLASAMHNTRSDIVVIPNPIELESYIYSERANPSARLIWLRAFHRIYNPKLAVRVLAAIVADREDAHLTMVGPDKDGSLEEVRAEAARLGVLDRVLFTGGVPKADVARWLSTGDIFLNTTTMDNAPVSVLEAMATGLPVVSTAVGGIPYLLDDGDNGLLVPTGDADAMARAVKRLLHEPGLAARLSRNARLKSESFGWNATLPRWETLLVELSRNGSSSNARQPN